MHGKQWLKSLQESRARVPRPRCSSPILPGALGQVIVLCPLWVRAPLSMKWEQYLSSFSHGAVVGRIRRDYDCECDCTQEF